MNEWLQGKMQLCGAFVFLNNHAMEWNSLGSKVAEDFQLSYVQLV